MAKNKKKKTKKTSPPAPPRETKFDFSAEFEMSYDAFLKLDPKIKKKFETFIAAKRSIPPRRLLASMKDHHLGDKMDGMKDCHLADDILLIYAHADDVVTLIKVCTHADLY